MNVKVVINDTKIQNVRSILHSKLEGYRHTTHTTDLFVSKNYVFN